MTSQHLFPDKKPPLTFMMPGFPKCATTSFCDLLGQHKDVFISTPKEPGFFSFGKYSQDLKWEWYNSIYKGSEDYQAVGDCSVNYCCSRYRGLAEPKLISELYPDLALIFIVRDPIKRIMSHWRHHAVIGHPKNLPRFNRAVEEFSMFLNTSRYYSHISRYRRHFSDENIKVIFYEDFATDPVTEIEQTLSFLGLDPSISLQEPNKPRNANTANYRDNKLTARLRNIPGAKALREFSPQVVRQALRPLLKDKNDNSIVWNRKTLEWAIMELEDDWLRLLEYAGRDPHDFPLDINTYPNVV